MTNPCILCIAITGSVPRKENNPAVPITVAEQIESTHEAFEAGADHVQLAVVEGNTAGVRLYEKLGFEPFARLRTILFSHT